MSYQKFDGWDVLTSKAFHDFCKAVGIDIGELDEPFIMHLEEGVIFGALLKNSDKFIRSNPPEDGYGVYRMPEFITFCQTFGIAWQLLTKSLTFTIAEGELLSVKQEYLASTNLPPIPKVSPKKKPEWMGFLKPYTEKEEPKEEPKKPKSWRDEPGML